MSREQLTGPPCKGSMSRFLKVFEMARGVNKRNAVIEFDPQPLPIHPGVCVWGGGGICSINPVFNRAALNGVCVPLVKCQENKLSVPSKVSRLSHKISLVARRSRRRLKALVKKHLINPQSPKI